MKCEEFEKFAEVFVDGEFDTSGQAEADAHLATCNRCQKLASQLEAFRLLLRHESQNDAAPAHLKAKLDKALDRAVVPTQTAARWTWRVAGALAGLLLLAINVLPDASTEDEPSQFVTDPIIEASVDWHRRNLPVDVTGPDTSTIRDWFMNKVDFPVRLPTFDESLNANVLGGRLTQLNNQSAAHVVYEIEGAKVSVILFNSPNLRVPSRASVSIRHNFFYGNRQGYNVALFRNNGVTYAITTEIPQPTFNEMVDNVAFSE